MHSLSLEQSYENAEESDELNPEQDRKPNQSHISKVKRQFTRMLIKKPAKNQNRHREVICVAQTKIYSKEEIAANVRCEWVSKDK